MASSGRQPEEGILGSSGRASDQNGLPGFCGDMRPGGAWAVGRNRSIARFFYRPAVGAIRPFR